MQKNTIVELIEDIFIRRGAESYLGEAVTMSQHMLQSAQLAENSGASEDVIVAALLHDIGHYTNEFPDNAADLGIDARHEHAGASVMGSHFPQSIVDCIRYHVDAKRFLCATDPDYHAQLSEASQHSLTLQGGPMSAEEVADFKKLPHLDAILQVRRWDDQAKDPHRTTPSFAHYKPMIENVVETHSG